MPWPIKPSTHESLTVRELASRWGVAASTVYARLEAGELEADPLPEGRKGGKTVPLSEVERWERERGGAA